MDNMNLLSGGVDNLNEIKENLFELHGYQAKYSHLTAEIDKLEKSLQAEEKAVMDEIQSTTKKRRQEIEDTFDKHIDKTKSRIRKAKNKRSKYKYRKVSERIKAETSTQREENRRLKSEAKLIFKQNHIPSFCNSYLFYALYFPKFIEDFLTIILTLLLTLFVIPCGIYFFLLPKDEIIYLIITYVITVVFFGGLYLIIENRTKDRHLEVMRQVRVLKSKYRANKVAMKKIKRRIKRDRDESSYGLEEFDKEIEKLDREGITIENQKKEALITFENTTSQIIAKEIRGLHEDRLNSLRSELGKAREEASKADEKVKALSIKIANEYEPFLGKDLMTLDRIDSLINIIQAGNASTVSEAVAFYRKNIKPT